MKKQPKIKSKYDSKETFSFEETPGEFDSVTEESINDIKAYCSRLIKDKYKGNYDARTLYAMVGTVIGNFDLLYSRLRQDYNSRSTKLKKAQSKGVKKVNQRIIEFEKVVADHEIALGRHNQNMIDFDDQPIDEGLHYDRGRIQEFKNRLKNIEEKNHEA